MYNVSETPNEILIYRVDDEEFYIKLKEVTSGYVVLSDSYEADEMCEWLDKHAELLFKCQPDYHITLGDQDV